MLDIHLNRHASDILNMMPSLICRIDLFPAFFAQQPFHGHPDQLAFL